MVKTTLNSLGQDIFESRYAYPGETKWSERAKVIAKTIASAEPVSHRSLFFHSILDQILQNI